MTDDLGIIWDDAKSDRVRMSGVKLFAGLF